MGRDSTTNNLDRDSDDGTNSRHKCSGGTKRISLEQYVEKLRITGATTSSSYRLEDKLFEMFHEDNRMNMRNFLAAINRTGIKYKTDPRLKKLQYNIDIVEHYLMSHIGHEDESDQLSIDKDLFTGMIIDDIELLHRIFTDSLVIPDFQNFTSRVKQVFNKIRDMKWLLDEGKVATYIPQLGRADENWFGVSVCTVDGQMWSVGDTKIPYTVQSTCKPINYALNITDHGADYVHQYIGKEPSGVKFNQIALDSASKPHNPMINSGAIMSVSMFHPEMDISDRFDLLQEKYRELCGGMQCSFNNSVYLSEAKEGHRNYALGHYMQEKNSFPPNTDLQTTLDFYFQSCSLEVNAESHAVMAATLANSGTCPLTEKKILTHMAVRKCLSLMLSCGMYDYSGQFAFEIGIPAKSGVSGCIMLVIPNVCGITIFSPPLDECGNSVRGLEFCREIVKIFTFHHLDAMMPDDTCKLDPRKGCPEVQLDKVTNDLLFACHRGDVQMLRKIALSGHDMRSADYDGRTALHVAVCEDQIQLVRLLLDHAYSDCDITKLEKDRYGRTALDDAKLFDHSIIVLLLEGWFDTHDRTLGRDNATVQNTSSLVAVTDSNGSLVAEVPQEIVTIRDPTDGTSRVDVAIGSKRKNDVDANEKTKQRKTEK